MDKAHLQKLQESKQDLDKTHLRDLLKDEQRNDALVFESDKVTLDLTHEKISKDTIDHFQSLTENTKLFDKINAMFEGKKINSTENRAVLHVALRETKEAKILVDGEDVIPDVIKVRENVEKFTNQVREGAIKGYTGKPLKTAVIIGIGGSYLGVEFVYEALKYSPEVKAKMEGRSLRFLANVDPIDFARATDGLNCEETLFIISSKTFTTAETMLNARTSLNWLLSQYKNVAGVEYNEQAIIKHHFAAVSTALDKTKAFGIADENVFGFWNWVGGRYSVWSAIGVLPLSFVFEYSNIQKFLDGANNMDKLFKTEKDVRKNLPLMLGLIGFYNTTISGYTARAILPYCQALTKFTPHIQQLDMESNGKRISIGGKVIDYDCTVVNFGEPGTNGQHSFYQLLHQGRTVPGEFIGFIKSQQETYIQGEPVTNHQELMSNFFSQPDALAQGKTPEDLKAENVAEELIPHKTFPGDRPSLSILMEELTPYTCGQLLAMYEHRTVTEGFLWDICSFDQWGVELGKVLAKSCRELFQRNQKNEELNFDGFTANSATKKLLGKFFKGNKKVE